MRIRRERRRVVIFSVGVWFQRACMIEKVCNDTLKCSELFPQPAPSATPWKSFLTS
jgi:hypothetical protein